MISTRRWLAVSIVAAALGVFGFAQAADSDKAMKAKGPAKDLVLKGDAVCTECHDEADAPEKLAIGKTRHGVVADGRTPTCTSCHGPSDAHAKNPQGLKDRPAADVGFSKRAKADATTRSASCLGCHQGQTRIAWQSSMHANRDVDCSSCHNIHTPHDKVRDRTEQTQVCFTCHKQQRAELTRPSHHPVPEGVMACSSCHNVHGDNPKQMVRASVNEVCYSCHMEKRGPFLHNHQPVTEDCGICHNPHGTTAASLLKSRQPYLCQECHSHSSHPGQVAGLPAQANVINGGGRVVGTNGTSSLGTIGRGCSSCHTNIHGSNSTQNNPTAERFRR